MTVTARRCTFDRKKPFPVYDWKEHERRDFTVEIDGENIIVDGYSMPVKEDREFTFSCKKSFIKAIHGAEGLYKFIDKEKSGAMECYVRNIVNWVMVYGKKENIQEKEGATA